MNVPLSARFRMLSWKSNGIVGTLFVHENEGFFHLNVIFHCVFYGVGILVR